MKRHVPEPGRKSVYYSVNAAGQKMYEVRYRDSDGRDRFKTCGPRLKDALDFQASVRTKLAEGVRYAPSNRTFADVAAEWVEHKMGEHTELAGNTIKLYDSVLKNHLLPAFEHKRLQSITVDDVARFLKKKEYCPGYRINMLIVLRQIMGYAASPRRGYLSVNPCDYLEKRERPSREKTPVRVLLPGEADRLLAAAPDQLRSVIALSLTTGLRLGEIMGLRWEDISFDDNTLHVQRQLLTGKRINGVKIGPPKSGKPRKIELFPGARKELISLPSRFQGGFVYVNERGNPQFHGRIGNMFRQARVDAGLSTTPRPFRFHDCRHTFASALLEGGKDIVWVSEILGHSSPKITMELYWHVINREDRLEEASTRLADALGEWAR